MVFFSQDNTVSVNYVQVPTAGYYVKNIDVYGTQYTDKVIDQVLDSFAASPGSINNTDSIVQAIQKIVPALPNYFTSIHITSGSSTTTTLAANQSIIIVDSGVTGKNIVLPASSDPNLITGWPYRFILVGGVITTNNIKCASGDYLNNVQNGTLGIAGLLSAWNSVTAIFDGSKWYISP